MLPLFSYATLGATFSVTFHVTREVRGAVYPVVTADRGVQCPMPPASVYADCACEGGLARRRELVGTGSQAGLNANTVSLDTGSFYSGSGTFYPAFSNAPASLAYASEFLASALPEAYGLTYRDFVAGGAQGHGGAGPGAAGLARYIELARQLDASLPKAVVTNLNLTAETTLSGFVEPYTLIDLDGGKKLAVLSLTDPTHLHATLPDYAARLMEYRRSLTVALATLRRLATPPHVVVVMVTHMPITDAEAAAAGSRAGAEAAAFARLVDEIIGVDVYLLGAFDAGVAAVNATVHVRTNWVGDRVLVVPARGLSHGTAIDIVSTTFDADGLLVSGSASATALDCNANVHAATAANVASKHAEATTLLSSGLLYMGTQHSLLMGTSLDSSPTATTPPITACNPTDCPRAGCLNLGTGRSCGCRVDACRQGSLVADALRDWTSADAALLNAGAIGATYIYSGQYIAKGDLLQLLPYNDEIVQLTLSGSTLRAALAHSISGLRLSDAASNPDGRFLQLSTNVELVWHFQAGAPVISQVVICHEAPPPPPPTPPTLPTPNHPQPSGTGELGQSVTACPRCLCRPACPRCLHRPACPCCPPRCLCCPPRCLCCPPCPPCPPCRGRPLMPARVRSQRRFCVWSHQTAALEPPRHPPRDPPRAASWQVRIDGQQLNTSHMYTIAAPAFVAHGGDGFTMLAVDGVPSEGVTARHLGETAVDAVVAYLVKHASLGGTGVPLASEWDQPDPLWDVVTQEPERILLQVTWARDSDTDWSPTAAPHSTPAAAPHSTPTAAPHSTPAAAAAPAPAPLTPLRWAQSARQTSSQPTAACSLCRASAKSVTTSSFSSTYSTTRQTASSMTCCREHACPLARSHTHRHAPQHAWPASCMSSRTH